MRIELGSASTTAAIIPWVRRIDGQLQPSPARLGLAARPRPAAGPRLRPPATFTVSAGDAMPFVFTWHPSHQPQPRRSTPSQRWPRPRRFWTDWVAQCTYHGPWRDAVVRSLITLKALTYEPTGGIVAAPTTSLPEDIGGVRNWDYRYCWLRDATHDAGGAARSRLPRRGAAPGAPGCCAPSPGRPEDLQIMYGVAGERRLTEYELDWLPGYEGSRPVRVGNAAVDQLQLDVYGEVTDSLHLARSTGMQPDDHAWSLQRELMDFLEAHWDEPDEGLWEVRGPRRHFVHSKVMAWVAVDRAIRQVEEFGREGPSTAGGRCATEIHAEVCAKGFDPERGTFTQSYGSQRAGRRLLLIPHRRLPAAGRPARDRHGRGDPARADAATVSCCATRPAADNDVDGLPGGEGAFLACSFWLAEALAMIGRKDEAVDAVRAPAGPAQRRRPARRGVRPPLRPPGRQLPPGLQPRSADPHGPRAQLSRSPPALFAPATTVRRPGGLDGSSAAPGAWLTVSRWRPRRRNGPPGPRGPGRTPAAGPPPAGSGRHDRPDRTGSA